MQVFVAGAVGLLGVVLVIAGVQSHGGALFTALTGQGLPAAKPTKDVLSFGAPIGTGSTPTGAGGVPYSQQIPGLPPIPGMPYPVIPGVTK